SFRANTKTVSFSKLTCEAQDCLPFAGRSATTKSDVFSSRARVFRFVLDPRSLQRSRYGTNRMEMRGSIAAMVGGSAATGSSRYSLTTSSVMGTDAQKYPNVLLKGITSPRKRSANWPTLTLERLLWAVLTGLDSPSLGIWFLDLDS